MSFFHFFVELQQQTVIKKAWENIMKCVADGTGWRNDFLLKEWAMQGIKKHKFGLTHTRAVPSLLHRLVRKKADKTRGIRRDPEVIYSRKMVFTREEQNSPHLKASCRQPCVPTANPTTNYYPKTLVLVIFPSCQDSTPCNILLSREDWPHCFWKDSLMQPTFLPLQHERHGIKMPKMLLVSCY